ncbi:hypothetical protein AB0I55_12600 [Actinocatenispora sera]|uniref:hypothetical protein n=1 Tax=Actinocatenispora sera TaxID=390989 RepID=UPI003405A99D
MRLSRLLVASAAAIVAVGVTVSGVVSATGGTAAPPAGAPIHVVDPPAAPAAAPAPAAPTNVTLVTGDRVRVDGQTVTPLSAGPPMVRFTWGGDAYAVPAAAVQYLGSTLDVRLFDVSYLARTGGSVPVTVQTTGAAAPLAAGTSTLSATAHRIGSKIKSGKLTGVKKIRLAHRAGGAALPVAPAVAAPTGSGLSYETLTVDAVDRNGAAAQGIVLVQNVDDSSLALILSAVDGSASFSVPEGTYSVVADLLTPGDGGTWDGTLVAQPQVSVRRDRTVDLDARPAKPYRPVLDPSLTTPNTRVDEIGVTRTGVHGDAVTAGGVTFGLLSWNPDPLPGYRPAALYAARSSRVTEGSFDFDAVTQLSNSPALGTTQTGPTYLLSFPHAGSIPSGVNTTLSASDLTTVDDDVYGQPGAAPDGYLTFTVSEPWGYSAARQIAVTTGDRTDFWYTSAPGVDRWRIRSDSSDSLNRESTFLTARHGGHLHQTWNAGPMVPSPAALTVRSILGSNGDSASTPVSQYTTMCPACRQDDNGTLFLAFADSDPTHSSSRSDSLTPSRIRFTRNGTLAWSSDNLPAGSVKPYSVPLPMLHQPANYTLDWTIGNGSGSGDPAAITDTHWAFTSQPGAVTDLPAGEQCAPDASRSCAALPLLFVNYQLALNHQSQAAPGTPFTISFTVGHQQGAPAATGLGATVSVSYDDGKTWSDPKGAQADGGGKFSLAIQHPDSPGYVSLRVDAHDGAGNTVRQTVIHAYQLAS